MRAKLKIFQFISEHPVGVMLFMVGALCLLIFATPVFMWLGLGGFAVRVKLAFALICHQIPERSFELGGFLMPVCARCTGFFLGPLLGFLILKIWPLRHEQVLGRLILGFAPMALDGTAQLLKLYPSPGWLRTTTGLIAGATIALVVVPAAEALKSKTQSLDAALVFEESSP